MRPLRSEHKEDADWLQDLPSSVPSLRATNELCIEARKKKDWHEMCSDGYERKELVLKKGISTRVGSSVGFGRLAHQGILGMVYYQIGLAESAISTDRCLALAIGTPYTALK
ncbi:BZ3501_MvSof-1269-A2-R1_Chr12-3g03595 [Microbotryum saponariae]|nr:BZ3501_MvSof-1269-A2-R1_Chr12-3g03595 [Microbotryum saponariae]